MSVQARSVLRKLNFTDRVKIPKSNVQITLQREADGVLFFNPRLTLADVAVSGGARVYVEAYYRTSYMRFDCGTVASLAIPVDRRLTEIESENAVRFRVKVVDHSVERHRIVAVADDILAVAKGETSSGRVSLLPVNFDDLGEQVWRIHFESTGPVLELNNRIAGIEQMAKLDPRFFALVYPAAVGEILTYILLVESHDLADEADEWWGLWLRWADGLTESPLTDDRDNRAAWIQEVVAAFCEVHGAAAGMAEAR